MSNVKILREILANVEQVEINRIAELIFLIIEHRVLHFDREVNTKLLLTTIDTIMITNHTSEIRKIRMIKEIFNDKKYIIDHLRLQQTIKKIFDFDKENDAKNTNTIEKANDHEENKEEKKKKMTDK